MEKALEYAYPSSSMAEDNGFGKVGDWYVSLCSGLTARQIMRHFGPDKTAAVAYLNSLDYPTHKYSHPTGQGPA